MHPTLEIIMGKMLLTPRNDKELDRRMDAIFEKYTKELKDYLLENVAKPILMINKRLKKFREEHKHQIQFHEDRAIGIEQQAKTF